MDRGDRLEARERFMAQVAPLLVKALGIITDGPLPPPCLRVPSGELRSLERWGGGVFPS